MAVSNNMGSARDKARELALKAASEKAKKAAEEKAAAQKTTTSKAKPVSTTTSSKTTKNSAPVDEKEIKVGMDRVREQDKERSALTKNEQSALTKDQSRRNTARVGIYTPNDSTKRSSEYYKQWLGSANKAVRNAESSKDIDTLLSDVPELRAWMYESSVSNDKTKNGNGASNLAFSVKLMEDLEKQLKTKKTELKTKEEGIAKHGSVAGYDKAQKLKGVDTKQLAQEVADAQLGSSQYEELVRENKGIEEQLGFAYDDVIADQGLMDYIQSDPAKKAGFDALEQNRKRMNATGESLAQAGIQADAKNIPAITDQVFQKERDLKQAQSLQYADLSKTDPDFSKKAARGRALVNPSYDELYSWGGEAIGRPIDETKIANKATFARDNYFDIGIRNKDADLLKLMRYMTDEPGGEVDTYSSILDEHGMVEADAYAQSLKGQLDARMRKSVSENIGSKTEWEQRPTEGGGMGFSPVQKPGDVAMQMYQGFAGSAHKSMQGIGRVFGASDDDIDPGHLVDLIGGDMQNVGPVIPDNIPIIGGRTVGQVGYDFASNAGGMAPTLLSHFVAPGSAAWVTALGAAGNAYQEGVETHGMSQSQAQLFSVIVGASEAGLGQVLGFGAAGGGKAVRALGAKTDNIIGNAAARALVSVLGDTVSEGSEEYLQSILEPIAVKLAKDENINWEDFDWDNEEAIYAAFMGAVMGLSAEGTAQISTAIDKTSTGKGINAGQYDMTTPDLVSSALGKEQDSLAYKLAQSAQSKLDAGESLSSFAAGDLFYAAAGAADAMTAGQQGRNAARDLALEQARAQASTPDELGLSPEDVDAALENDMDTPPEQKAVLRDIVTKAVSGAALSPEEVQIAQENPTARQLLAEVQGGTVDQAQYAAAPTQAEPPTQVRPSARDLAMEMAAAQAAPSTEPVNKDAVRADGSPARVSGIAALDNGVLTLKTEDGGTIAADQMRFASPDTQYLYDQATGMDSVETARAYVSGYDGDVPAELYTRAWKGVYDSAAVGLTLDQIENGINGMGALGMLGDQMSYPARLKAFYRGEAVWEAQQQREQMAQTVDETTETVDEPIEAVDEDLESVGEPADRKAGLNREYSADVKLTKQQNTELRLLDALGKKYGLTIVATDQVADGMANGSYDPETGVIEIAIDAIDQAYLYVGTHELIHFVQAWNPDEYAVMQDYVLDRLKAESGYSLDKRIEQYMEAREGMTREQAMEEIVADAIPAIWADESNVRDFVGQHRTLGEKIRDFLGEFIAEIRRVITRLGKTKGRYEIDLLAKDADTLTTMYDLFNASLEGAAANTQNGEGRTGNDKQYLIKSNEMIEAEDTDKNIEAVAKMGAVATLLGDEFEKGEKNLLVQVSEYFDSLGNTVANPVLGDVDIDGQGIRASIAHGIGRVKSIAFKAVPDIIANGKIIDFQKNWKGRGYDTVVLAAPIEITDGRYAGNYYAAAIVERKANSQGFYLHELVTEKRTDASFKTSSLSAKAPSTSDAPYPSLMSLLEKVRDVKTQNTSGEDLRYSMKDLGTANVSARLDEDPDVLNSVALLSNLAEKSHAVIAQMRPTAVRAAAGEVATKTLTYYQSQYNRATLIDNLETLYNAVGDTTDWADTVRIASDLGKAVVAQSEHVDAYLQEHYKAVRTKLRETPITLTGTQLEEVASAYGSFNNFRKANFGRLNIRKEGGTSLDSLWQELSAQNPELFDTSTSEGDQPTALVEALDALKPVYRNLYGMDMNSAALDAGMHMLLDYFDTVIKGKAQVAAEKARYEMKQQLAAQRKQYKDKYEERLKDVNRENIRKRQAFAKEYRKTTTDAQRKAMSEQYRKLTDRRNVILDRQKAYYQEMRANERTRRSETGAASKYRASIETSIGKLQQWLSKPSDTHHVPEFLREKMTKALASFDLGGRGGKETQKGLRWSESMRSLLDEVRGIDAAMNGEGGALAAKYEGLYMTLDPNLLPALQEFIDGIGERGTMRISDLTGQQLKDLDYITKVLMRAMTTMGQTWSNARYQTMAELGGESIAEMEGKKQRKSRGKVVDMLGNFLNIDQLDSFSFFKELGGAGQSVLDALYSGWQKSVQRIRQASDATDAMLGDLRINKKTLRQWSADAKGYKLGNGQSVSLSTAQVIDLYNLMQRPQAQKHILDGGIRPDNIEGKGGKQLRQAKVNVTEADIARITGTLTDAQRALADQMRAYLSDEAASWGNETSMELYLYEKYGEKNYWPIRSDKDFTKSKTDEQATAFNAIRNMGFTKALVTGASNPVMLGNALQVYSDHIVQMATYNGLAAPMDDAMKWYNYTQRTANLDGTSSIDTSIKEQLRMLMGDVGKRYVETFMKDVNGLSSGNYGTELGNTLLGKFKANAIAGSLRVVIQQPTSILRSAAVINPKYLLTSATVNRSKALREMQQWAPVAWWKAQGNFEMGVGQSMRQIIVGDDTRIERWQKKTMALAGWADDMTWAQMWDATKREVRAKNIGIDVTSDAYFEKVAARFTDMVNQTQVVDSVFHRSQMMRSKDGLTKMATAFMSEPTKTYNLLRNAAVDVAQGGARAKMKLVRTTVAWTASVVLNAVVKALWDAWRKKGEDDDYWKMVETFAKDSLVNDINPLNMLPWARDIMTLLQGYDIERSDMSMISDLINTCTETYEHFFGEGTRKSDYAIVSTLVKQASGFTGLPLNGIITSAEGVANGLTPGAIIWTKQGAADAYAKMYEYMQGGETEKAADLRTRVQTQTSEVDGKAANKMQFTLRSDKEIDTGVAAVMAVQDARIAEAWTAREKADTKTVASIKQVLVAEGFNGEIVDKAIAEYAKTQEEKEPKEKDLAEPLKAKLYAKENLWAAIDKAVGGGSSADVQAIAQEIMADSDAKDPITTIKSYVSEKYKDEYIKLRLEGQARQAERLAKVLTDNGWYTQDGLDGWVESDMKGSLWTALEAGETRDAQKHAQKLLESGLVDNDSLRNSLNSKYIGAYKDLYFSGQVSEAERLIEAMRSLSLTGTGGNAWNEAWLNKNWRSKKSLAKWEEAQMKIAG